MSRIDHPASARRLTDPTCRAARAPTGARALDRVDATIAIPSARARPPPTYSAGAFGRVCIQSPSTSA